MEADQLSGLSKEDLVKMLITVSKSRGEQPEQEETSSLSSSKLVSGTSSSPSQSTVGSVISAASTFRSAVTSPPPSVSSKQQLFGPTVASPDINPVELNEEIELLGPLPPNCLRVQKFERATASTVVRTARTKMYKQFKEWAGEFQVTNGYLIYVSRFILLCSHITYFNCLYLFFLSTR